MTTRPEGRKVTTRREQDRWSKWDKRIRDLGLYIAGLGFATNELLFVKDGPRPFALVFIATILGFPLVLRADEARRP